MRRVKRKSRPLLSEQFRASWFVRSGSSQSRSRASRGHRDHYFWPRSLLCLLVVVAPQLLGSVFAWSTLGLAIAACAILAITLVQRRTDERVAEPNEPLLVPLLALLAVTILHAVPLPIQFMARLAPESTGHVVAVAKALEQPSPSWIAFSLDPGSTHERILFGVAIVCAFCAARLVSARSRSSTLLGAVAVSAGGVATMHLVHQLVGAKRVFGMYTPAEGSLPGPLLNPNNLAGYLSMALPICLGFALHQKIPTARAGWLGAAGLTAATALLARSRGGAVALIGGALLFSLLYWLRDDRGGVSGEHRRSRLPWSAQGREAIAITTVSLAIAGTLAALASSDFIDTNYQDLRKLDIYAQQVRHLLADPTRALLGVGRGGFSASFATLQRGGVRIQYAESLPLQYAIEFGIPLTVLVLVGFAVRISRALRERKSPIHLGALAGLIAIALQNLLDFSLELSGIALPAAVCLGAALPRTSPGQSWMGRLPSLVQGSVSALALGIPTIWLVGPDAVRNDLRHARAALNAAFWVRDVQTFWRVFESSVMAHPADAELAGIASAELVLENNARAPYWLNHALALTPGWEVPHLWAAHWLFARNRLDQGLAELQSAAEIEPGRASIVFCNWIGMAPASDTALRAAPEGPHRVDFLNLSANCLPAPEAQKVDQVILNHDPRHFGARLRRARQALVEHDLSSAKHHSKVLQQVKPRSAAPYLIQAMALQTEGRAAEAVQMLERMQDRVDERSELLAGLARAQATAGDALAMRGTVALLRADAAANRDKLVAAVLVLHSEELRLGNHQRALSAIRDAHRLSSNPAHLAAAARLAAQLGDVEFALKSWQELCRSNPRDMESCRASQALAQPSSPTYRE